MATYDFDLFVIGAGSGGVRAGRMAAARGAKVAVAEERFLGGTCVNVGCIPKKLFVYAADAHNAFEDAKGFGWKVGRPSFDMAAFVANKNKEIDRLNTIYRRLLSNSGAQLIEGRAKLVSDHEVEVNDQRYSAKYILVAVGGRPFKPEIPGIGHAIISDDAFFLSELPKRIVVGGGGYIGVEFAGVFQALGAEVTLVHRGDQVLRGFDLMLREGLAEQMHEAGIKLRLGERFDCIEKKGDAFEVQLSSGDFFETDLVLAAMGRRPYTNELGLEAAGVELGKFGEIKVDAFSQTSCKSIYAIGDVTDRVQLTPMAIREGMALVETLFNDNPTQPDHSLVPTAVFSHPPIGTVGLTEGEARQQYEKIDVYESTFTPLKHRLSPRPEKARLKLIVDAQTDVVVGCHMLGTDAPEIIQGFAVAMRCGATKKQFDATLGIHPTAAEEFVTMRTKRNDDESARSTHDRS